MNDWFEAEQHVERAHEFFELSRWDEAEFELREAIALNPYRAEWHFNLGLTLEAAGRRREAIKAFEETRALQPDEQQLALLLGVNHLRADDANHADFKKAVHWLKEAARCDKHTADATVHLIEAHARLGDHDQAEVYFYLALQLADTDLALAYVNVADSLLDRRDSARAAAALREAIQIDPTMPGVYARLAGAYASLKKYDRARRLFLRELRTNPGDIDTLLDLGCLLVDMNRPLEAAEKFRRVLEIQNDNADAHYELGALALREHRLEDARRSLRLVLRLDPRDQRAHRRLAEIHLLNNRRNDARAILAAQARSLPDRLADYSTDDRQELGAMSLEVGLYKESAAILSAVLNERPDDPALLQTLSVALLRSGDLTAGVRLARKGYRLAPDSVAAIHNIALALINANKPRRAAVWIRKGQALAPHDHDLRRLRRRLRVQQLFRLFKR